MSFLVDINVVKAIVKITYPEIVMELYFLLLPLVMYLFSDR